MERKTAVARCAECGEVLSEGDAAYSLLGKTICTTCVKHGFIRIYNIIRQKTREGGVER